MYESNIDAIEEYIETLIDGYNDYIDSVKEALDAERDLYEFKKNVQKQAKDIAELERRIASLSGSTNKSEIAERRKLEAQLYEARESLNDTYYDHAKDSQNEALDTEQSAYEETMTKMVEGMRESLETATQNMDEFLMGVTSMVTLNADAVLQKYQETQLPLDDALTNPWEAAKTAVGDYSEDALELMNTWTQNGFFTTTPAKIQGSLESPWNAGKTAVGLFKTSVDTEMGNVVKTIEANVKKASSKLSALYKQIEDTENRAAGGGGGGGSGGGGGGGSGGDGSENVTTPPSADVKKLQQILNDVFQISPLIKEDGILGPETTNAITQAQQHVNRYFQDKVVLPDGVYDNETRNAFLRYLNSKINQMMKMGSSSMIGQGVKSFTLHKNNLPKAFYAKGTTGITRDQWAITDEPQFGDELVLVPGKDGNLSFMRKGTGVVPADMTQKLFELAQIPTSDLMRKNITAIVPDVTKNDISNQFNFDSLVHVDYCDQNTLKDLEKMVDNKINDFSKQMNYSLKKFTR